MSARPQPLPAPARGARIDAVLAAGLRALKIDPSTGAPVRSRDEDDDEEFNEEEFNAIYRAKKARRTSHHKARTNAALEIKGPIDSAEAEFEFYVRQIEGDYGFFCDRSNELYSINEDYILKLVKGLKEEPHEYLLWVIVQNTTRGDLLSDTVFGFCIARQNRAAHIDNLIDWVDYQYRFDLKLICSLRGLGSEMLKRTIAWARGRVSDFRDPRRARPYPAFYTIDPLDIRVAKMYWQVFFETEGQFPFYFKSGEMAIPLNFEGGYALENPSNENNRLTSHEEYWAKWESRDEIDAAKLARRRQREKEYMHVRPRVKGALKMFDEKLDMLEQLGDTTLGETILTTETTERDKDALMQTYSSTLGAVSHSSLIMNPEQKEEGTKMVEFLQTMSPNVTEPIDPKTAYTRKLVFETMPELVALMHKSPYFHSWMHFVLLHLVNLDYDKIPILLLNVGLFVNFREMVKWFEMARTRIVTDLYKKPPIDQAVATNVLNRLEMHIRDMFVTYAQEITDVLGL